MEKKLIRIDNKVIILLPETSDYIEYTLQDESEFQKIQDANTRVELYQIIDKDTQSVVAMREQVLSLQERVKNSDELIWEGECVYLKNAPKVSLPKSLITKILDAEDADDTIKLETYKNFWTLMSLNPDERCRQNLFWYLDKFGMQLSRTGFFVGYRNVDVTEKAGIYTDHRTHTMEIKIGKIVSMPREQCDCDQHHQCSSGLHLSNKEWLTEGYFGEVGLTCLCNPADVVCVPYDSDYGKIRTCAYIPIALTTYDENHKVIPFDEEDGFECKYVTKVIYEGLINEDNEQSYKIKIPDIIETSKKSIEQSLYNIAFKNIINTCK